MKLYKKNNKIYVDILVKGKRVRKSLGLEWNKENIKKAELELVPKLVKDLEIATEYLLSDMIDKSLKQKEQHIRKSSTMTLATSARITRGNIEDKLLHLYTPNDIQIFVDNLSKKGYCSSTINLCLLVLSTAFSLGIKMNLITFNPVFKVSVKKKKSINRVVYTKEECKLLLDNAKGDLKTFLYIALYTGARAGEILALTKEDIQDNYIVINKSYSILAKMITETKTGGSRRIFMANKLKEYLQHNDLIRTSYDIIKKRFIILCKKLGLEYAGLHSLRHTYASLLLNDRVDPLVIKESLGHSNLKMLENVYGHFLGFRDCDEENIQNSLKF